MPDSINHSSSPISHNAVNNLPLNRNTPDSSYAHLARGSSKISSLRGDSPLLSVAKTSNWGRQFFSNQNVESGSRFFKFFANAFPSFPFLRAVVRVAMSLCSLFIIPGVAGVSVGLSKNKDNNEESKPLVGGNWVENILYNIPDQNSLASNNNEEGHYYSELDDPASNSNKSVYYSQVTDDNAESIYKNDPLLGSTSRATVQEGTTSNEIPFGSRDGPNPGVKSPLTEPTTYFKNQGNKLDKEGCVTIEKTIEHRLIEMLTTQKPGFAVRIKLKDEGKIEDRIYVNKGDQIYKNDKSYTYYIVTPNGEKFDVRHREQPIKETYSAAELEGLCNEIYKNQEKNGSFSYHLPKQGSLTKDSLRGG